MGWVIPDVAWWQTRHEQEEVVRSRVRSPQRVNVWAAFRDDDAELDPEDEDLLYALASREDDDDDVSVVDHLDYWTAELQCANRGPVATIYTRLFEHRDEVVAFIRWFTLNIDDIPHQKGPAPTPSDADERWEEKFGPVVSWSFPTDVSEWRSYRDDLILTFHAGGRAVFGTYAWAVRPAELDDFLVWLKEVIPALDIDPSDQADTNDVEP